MSHASLSLQRRKRDRRLNHRTMIGEVEQNLRILRLALDRIRAGHTIEGSTQQDIEESIIEGEVALDYLRTRK